MRCPRSKFARAAMIFLAATAIAAAIRTRVGRGAPSQPRVAFLQWVDGYWQVFVMDADGANQRQLTASPVDKIAPSWCPEPDLVHFATASGDSLLYDLYSDTESTLLPGATLASLCKVDGAAPFWVKEVRAPDWMPEDQILVEVRRSSAVLYPDFEFHVLDLAQILALEQVPRVARNVLTDAGELIHVSDRGGELEIWVVDGDGTAARAITQLSGAVRNPALSPDGSWLVFEANHEGTSQLYRIALEGGPPQRLTDGVSPARNAVVSWPESDPLS